MEKMPDSLIEKMIYELQIADFEDVAKVLVAIRDVHQSRGDDNCWMDIDLIFKAAGLPVPDRSVGDKQAMKKNCERFIDGMCSGGKWKSYAELEMKIEELNQEIDRLSDLLNRNQSI